MERGSYGAEVSDELPVEVSKTQELLNLLAAIRRGPALTLAGSIWIFPGAMMKPRNYTIPARNSLFSAFTYNLFSSSRWRT